MDLKQIKVTSRHVGKTREVGLISTPGLIGTVVSWLLNRASEAVGWLATHLWAFILAIGGLLFLAARTYITRKSHPEHHKRPAAKKKAKKD